MSNLPNDPLLNISINSFAEKLRKGEINCEQIVTSYLNRIKAVNDKLNAFIFIDEKKAIKNAIAIDKLLKWILLFSLKSLDYRIIHFWHNKVLYIQVKFYF